MLKIHTDTSLLIEKNRSVVFPLLFDLFYGNKEYLSSFYTVVDDINKSDIVIIPLEYVHSLKFHSKNTNKIIQEAKQLKKSIWIYSGGDFGYSLKDKSIYNFRLSGFKSKLNERTIVMPSFINDPYKIHLKLEFKALEKESFSKIGFVGHANSGIKKYFKELLSYFKVNVKRVLFKDKKDYQSFYPSSIKRANYLKKLSKSKDLQTDFILRESYRAGVKTEDEKQMTTKEFYNNLYKNPYTFCIRGAGNFSIRLYETLAVGRIPIMINTDCKLPLSDVVDWGSHCLIVDESENSNVVEKILDFHKNLGKEDFIKLQKSNRNLWENYLKREAFFQIIHDNFKNKLN